MACESDFNGGFPVQLICRDFDPTSATYGQDLLTLPIHGPDLEGQGIAILEGYSGFYHTPITQIRENYAYEEGSTPSEYPRVEERILDFRIGTSGRSWQEFMVVETLLWRVMKPAKGKPRDFVLRMYYGPGEFDWREIKIRLERAPKDFFKWVPGVQRSQVWDITALACDPYWYSQTLSDTVTFDTGTGSGATRISDRVLTVSNHADQECWLEFASNELTATSAFTVPDGLGVYPSGHPQAGQRIAKPLPPLGPGRSFLVQTDPLLISLETISNTQDVANMRGSDFQYALPPHTVDAQLPVRLLGGTVQTQLAVYATQRWDRCWGGEAL